MNKAALFVLVLTLVLSLMVGPTAMVLADWAESDDYKMHHPQLPDLTDGQLFESSINEEGAARLADDFQCSETGPITGIHVWGGWVIWGDWSGDEVWDEAEFWIGIYADIPAGESYSRPGKLLWEKDFLPADYDRSEMIHVSDLDYFYPLGDGYYWDRETCDEIYQYNFSISPGEAFQQQAGTTYWLSVVLTYAADDELPAGVEGMWWGWISSEDAWNDDATWDFPDPTGWEELYYIECPESCVASNTSADLAFVVTSKPLPLTPVGGVSYPVNKLTILAPWIALAIVIAAGGIYLVRRRVND